VIAEGNIGQN